MKKLFTSLCLSVLALSASATIVTVNVGANGTISYSPANVVVNAGDTVRFQWHSGTHPTKSTNNMFTQFDMDANHQVHDLVLTNPGSYPYHCIPHQSMGMIGNITVNAVSSAPVAVKSAEVSVFPNPASQQVTVSYNFSNVDGVRVTNMIGQQVRYVKPQFGSSNKVEIGIADLPKGIYMVNIMSKGVTVFTQRLVKDK